MLVDHTGSKQSFSTGTLSILWFFNGRGTTSLWKCFRDIWLELSLTFLHHFFLGDLSWKSLVGAAGDSILQRSLVCCEGTEEEDLNLECDP